MNNPRKMMLHVQIVWEDREEAEYRLGLRAKKGENTGEADFKYKTNHLYYLLNCLFNDICSFQ